MAEDDGRKATIAAGPKWSWVIPLIAALITGIVGPALLGAFTNKATPGSISVDRSKGVRINSDDVTINKTIHNYGPARRFVESWARGARSIVGDTDEDADAAAVNGKLVIAEQRAASLKDKLDQLEVELHLKERQLSEEIQNRGALVERERQSFLRLRLQVSSLRPRIIWAEEFMPSLSDRWC